MRRCRSELVAATTRMFTATLGPPTGWISFSWSARRSLACRAIGMSPISSSRRVPPSASWNLPRRSPTPVATARADAEHLGLEQVGGDGRAVDGHERAAVAGRAQVDDVGEPLLPDPGLAQQQHGKVARDEGLHLGVEGAHGPRVAGHVAVGQHQAGGGAGGRGSGGVGGPAASRGQDDEEGDPQQPLGVGRGPRLARETKHERVSLRIPRHPAGAAGDRRAGSPRGVRRRPRSGRLAQSRPVREVGHVAPLGQHHEVAPLASEEASAPRRPSRGPGGRARPGGPLPR